MMNERKYQLHQCPLISQLHSSSIKSTVELRDIIDMENTHAHCDIQVDTHLLISITHLLISITNIKNIKNKTKQKNNIQTLNTHASLAAIHHEGMRSKTEDRGFVLKFF